MSKTNEKKYPSKTHKSIKKSHKKTGHKQVIKRLRNVKTRRNMNKKTHSPTQTLRRLKRKSIRRGKNTRIKKYKGGNKNIDLEEDITSVLGDNYRHMVIDTGKGYSVNPKITASVKGFHNDVKNTTDYSVNLKTLFINPNTNEEIAEFSVDTQMEFDENTRKMFMNDDGTFKLNPLYLLFFQGNKNSRVSSCPSMGISVEDDYQGLGLARFIIQMAVYTLDAIIDNTLLQQYFGLPLNEQIFAIDGDGSDGFWDRIGMVEHRAGYDYTGNIPLRCVGMEKVITVGALRKWAYAK